MTRLIRLNQVEYAVSLGRSIAVICNGTILPRVLSSTINNICKLNMKRSKIRFAQYRCTQWLTVILFLLVPTPCLATDSTRPGEISTPFPTITNLAVEWQIDGDDNRNATCNVNFRVNGDSQWQTGMPLRRVAAASSQKTSPIIKWTNRLSGSVLDLDPDTEYQIQLKLHDPDGGDVTRVVTVRTRPVPSPMKDASIKSAGPRDLNNASPGDIVFLKDGDYGAVYFNKDGMPGRPIVYRSATGRAVFDEVGLRNRKWVYLEGVTVNGTVRLDGTQNCAVMQCQINAQWGIKAYKPGMFNGYIADNIITGIRPWDPAIMGADGDNEGEGIQITGSGNVICNNRVTGFRDCLSHLEDSQAVTQMCNDWLNNDISAGLDDGIEADFALSNCRIMRNRITNCFVGISSQPGLGGPNYFIRNVMFNLTYNAFKLHRNSRGDVILHNTVVKAGDGFGIYTSEPFDDALIANNLFIGGKTINGSVSGRYGSGRGRAVNVQNFGENVVFDHNAFGTHSTPFVGKIRKLTFNSTSENSFDPHCVQVDLSVFALPLFPDDPTVVYDPPDLRLKSSSIAVDAGRLIPNLNEQSGSQLPDIGAYELDHPLPIYGPRPVNKANESTHER